MVCERNNGGPNMWDVVLRRVVVEVRGRAASHLNTWEGLQKENLLSAENKRQRDTDTARLMRTSVKYDRHAHAHVRASAHAHECSHTHTHTQAHKGTRTHTPAPFLLVQNTAAVPPLFGVEEAVHYNRQNSNNEHKMC